MRYVRAYGVCQVCGVPDSAVGKNKKDAIEFMKAHHSHNHFYIGDVDTEYIDEETYNDVIGYQGQQIPLFG